MEKVGVRELKKRASELIRMIRETHGEVQITYHGKTVALLIPVEDKEPEDDAAWVRLRTLSAQIGKKWPEGVSAAEAIREGRE